MTDIETIMDTDWDTDNVSKPTFATAPNDSQYMSSRVMYIEQIQKNEDYMDIVTSSYYDVDSFDSYRVTVGSTTLADATAIVDEIRRVCSQFTPSGDDKILYWEGGDWEYTPFWYRCIFVIFKKKSGAILTGI